MLHLLEQTLKKIIPSWILDRLIGNWSRQGFKKYLHNTSWVFLAQMFNMVISFLVGAWIMRYLGPEKYGMFSYVLAFVGIFTFIAQFGIGIILNRELVKTPERRDALLGTNFYLLVGSGIFAYGITVASAFIFETSSALRLLISIYATSYLWTALGILPIYYQSAVRQSVVAKISISTAVISMILKVLLILTKSGIMTLTLIAVFESLLSSILFVIAFLRDGNSIRGWKFEWPVAKYFLSNGWLIMLAAAASFLFNKIDQVIVNKSLGSTYSGLYASAVRFTEIWYFIPGVICGSLFPAIISAKKKSEEKYLDHLNKLYFLLGGIAFLIALATTLFAPLIIHIFLGAKYDGAITALQVYSWSSIGLFVLWGIQQHYLAENNLWRIFYVYLYSMLLNIGLNILFIHKFGLVGAAWASVISYSAAPMIFLAFLHKKGATTSVIGTEDSAVSKESE